MVDSAIHVQLKKLKEDKFEVTSPVDDHYNCIAWVLGIKNTVYWPDPGDQWEWPDDILRLPSRSAFVEFYSRHGFELCDDGEWEEGFQKIAIFMDEHEVTHAALMIGKDCWTSKLGEFEDIKHKQLWQLESVWYGCASFFMKRSIA